MQYFILLVTITFALLYYAYYATNLTESFSSTFVNSINSNILPDFRSVLKKYVNEEATDNCEINDIRTFNGTKPGIKLLIVGSVHGNEPAGTVACYKLIEKLSNGSIKLKSGKVTIIPTVNPCGVLNYTRTSNGIDLNRTYENGTIVPQQNRIVMDYVKKNDVVIDCHEGHGYYLLNGTLLQPNKSMGSTLTAGKGVIDARVGTRICSVNLAENSIAHINNVLNLTGHYRFSLYPDNDLKGTLRDYCNSINRPYVLIETTGQNEIQPINIRRDQQLLVFESIMRDIGIM
jgi:hypothetical protein